MADSLIAGFADRPVFQSVLGISGFEMVSFAGQHREHAPNLYRRQLNATLWRYVVPAQWGLPTTDVAGVVLGTFEFHIMHVINEGAASLTDRASAIRSVTADRKLRQRSRWGCTTLNRALTLARKLIPSASAAG